MKYNISDIVLTIPVTDVLKIAFKHARKVIYIQKRHDADLFSVSQFRAKTLTKRDVVREMLFADDSALVAHSLEDMQRMIDRFVKAPASRSTSRRQNTYTSQ